MASVGSHDGGSVNDNDQAGTNDRSAQAPSSSSAIGSASGFASNGETSLSASASAPVIRQSFNGNDQQPAISIYSQAGASSTTGSSLSRHGSGSGRTHNSAWSSQAPSSSSSSSPWSSSTVDRDPWRNTAGVINSDVGYTAHQLGFAPSTKSSSIRPGSRSALNSGTFTPPTSRLTTSGSVPSSTSATPVPVIIETVAPGSSSGFRVASRPSPLPSRSIASTSTSEVNLSSGHSSPTIAGSTSAGFSTSTPLSSHFGWVQQPTSSSTASPAWPLSGLMPDGPSASSSAELASSSAAATTTSPPPAERGAAVKRFHTLSHPHQDMASGSVTTATMTGGSRVISGWGAGAGWGSAASTSASGSGSGMVPPPSGGAASAVASGSASGSASRASDLARVLEHDGDEAEHGFAAAGVGVVGGLLHRQTSLPTGRMTSAGVATGPIGVLGGSALLTGGFGTVRKGTGMHPAAPSASLSRQSSQKSTSNLSRHPSISEEGGPIYSGSQSDVGHGSVNACATQPASIGRSASLRAGMAREEWRSTPLSPLSSTHNLQYGSGGVVGTSDSTSPGAPVPIGHHRSHSHSISRFAPSSDLLVSPTSSAGGSMMQDQSLAPGAGLAKSLSLRSSPSVGLGGAQHRQSPNEFAGRNLEQQMARARGTPPPTSNVYQADGPSSTGARLSSTNIDGVPTSTDPWADTKRYQQDTGAGSFDLGADAGAEESGLLRHKSLQEEYGASRRVQERLARSQALLTTESRQNVGYEQGQAVGPPSTSQAHGWYNERATSPLRFDNNEQPNPAIWSHAQSDYDNSARPVSQAADVHEERLRQALEAMQLGNEMMSPLTSSGFSAASSEADQVALKLAMNASLVQQNEALGRTGNMNAGLAGDVYDPLSRRSFSRPAERQMSIATDDSDSSYAHYHLPQPLLGQLGHAAPIVQTRPQSAAPEQNMEEILRQQHFELLRQQQGLQAAAASYGVKLPDYPIQVPQPTMPSMYYGDPGQPTFTPGMPHDQRFAGATYPNAGWQAHTPTPPPTIGRGAAPPAAAIPQEIASAAAKEVRDMVESRNINPASLDCDPAGARFFVIKSFTEDDVQKSLKHEIWASTTYGNQRLDKAFEEANGPVYLFFSVNGSGHFCGVAQMTSRVDYNTTSDVWAQDKWKGIFHVRWIYVKDIPNAVLRHIRLINTQEQKPITNSRDTQELLPDAGVEVLRIFVAYKQRTSLLEDFGYYEMQAAQRAGGGNNNNGEVAGGRPPSSATAPSPHYGNNNNKQFVKTFHYPTGPPSLGPQGPQGARFRVLGGSMNGQGGLRGGFA